MKESPQEAWASSVVAAALGVDLAFVDTDGRVDYKFTDPDGRSAALEVTTMTDRKLKGSVAAYARTRNSAGPLASLTSCWTVALDERDATFKGVEGRLEPHLTAFEAAGLQPGLWVTPRDVRATFRGTELAAGVEASTVELERETARQLIRWTPGMCEEDAARRGPHWHGIQISTAGEFAEVGTDVALEAIERFVRDHPDNLRKLADSGANVKHLFIRLDEESSVSVSHSVSRFAGPLVDGRDYFGPPTRPPDMPKQVDELWVVYEVEGEGWHWGDGHWERVYRGRRLPTVASRLPGP